MFAGNWETHPGKSYHVDEHLFCVQSEALLVNQDAGKHFPLYFLREGKHLQMNKSLHFFLPVF